MKLHRKIEHYGKVFHAQELGSYAQGQGSLAVVKVTARDQGHYKGPSEAFVTYCNISCFRFGLFVKNALALVPNHPLPPTPKTLKRKKKIIYIFVRFGFFV